MTGVDPQEEERGKQERKAARIRLGKARVQIMEFARLNPKARWEDFEKGDLPHREGRDIGPAGRGFHRQAGTTTRLVLRGESGHAVSEGDPAGLRRRGG